MKRMHIHVSVQDLDQSRIAPGERSRFWRSLGSAVYAHMKARKLEHSLFWGMMWDGEADPGLKDFDQHGPLEELLA